MQSNILQIILIFSFSIVTTYATEAFYLGIWQTYTEGTEQHLFSFPISKAKKVDCNFFSKV